MGTSNSKIKDDKALALCRERKRLVRQALDGRCLLADAHVSYIQSLRNTGTALRKFVDPETPTESYLYTSASARREPLASSEISAFLFSKSSSSFSRHVETVESISPVPSRINSVQLHSDQMKASRSFSMTVEEKPPIPVTETLQTEDNTQKDTVSQSEENLAAETPPIPGSPPWDYFETPHSVENQYSFHDGGGTYLELNSSGYVSRLSKEEGSLGLAEAGENVSTNAREDFVDSEDDFDEPSTAPLVRIFRNRNEVLDSNAIKESPVGVFMETVGSETETDQRNEQQTVLSNGFHDENSSISAPKAASSVVVHPVNGNGKEQSSANNIAAEVFLSCMREIEIFFLKASESGREVPRMLEANKVNFRPLFTDDKAHKSGASNFLTSCLSCCSEDVQQPEETVSNEVKALTCHRSASSLSSSSRNFTGVTSKDDVEDFSNNIFSSVCMTSGSHASTLVRLYAWERKLYDEVKASGIIQKKYEMKCRLLRSQESRAESPYKIDKTRAVVKDLHSRIIVALHRIDSISKKIEELRDKELQPQLEELIGGLTRMWEMMLNCHKHQHDIIMSVCNNGSTCISVKSESHRQAVLLLEFELNSLSSSFTQWISAHKSYLDSINGWLLKCVYPLRHKSSKKGKYLEFSPRSDGAPTIFVTCGDWLTFLKDMNFLAGEVETAIQNLLSVTTKFLPNQEKGHGNESKPVEDIQMNETTDKVIWNVDNFQTSLVVLLDQLKTFAETSLKKYVVLQKSIDSARRAYEN